MDAGVCCALHNGLTLMTFSHYYVCVSVCVCVGFMASGVHMRAEEGIHAAN